MKLVETKTTYVPKTATVQDYKYGGNVPEAPYEIQSDTVTRQCGVSKLFGDNIPDWKKLLSSHQGAVTDLSVTETSITVLGVARWVGHSPYGVAHPSGERCKSTITGNLCKITSTPQLPDYEELVHVDNLAKTEYLKNIEGRYRSLQGMVVVGEIRETVGLILSPGRKIVQLTERFRRDAERYAKRNYRKLYRRPVVHRVYTTRQTAAAAVEWPKWFSDLWLQYSFGVKPLVGDIDDGMRALSRIMNPADQLRYFKVQGKTSQAFPVDSQSWVEQASLFFNARYDVTRTTEAAVKYYGELDIAKSDFNTASSQLGLDFLSVVPAAWELIPWSFLIDYFANIGNVLETITVPQAGMLWNARGYAYTKDVTYKTSFHSMSGAYPGDWVGEAFDESVVRARGRILKRIPNVGYVLPRLERPSITSFSKKWKQEANVLALAISKLGSML